MIDRQQVRRPLVGVAMSVATGLAVQRGFSIPVSVLLCSGTLLLAVACWAVFARRSTFLIFPIIGLLAATHGAISAMPRAVRAVLPAAEVQFAEQEVVGTILSEATASDANGTVSFLYRVSAVHFQQDWVRADAVVQVYLQSLTETPQFGETWRFRGRYAGYEPVRSGVDGFFSVTADGGVCLRRASSSLLGICYRVRRKAADSLQLGIQEFPDQIGLLQALLLGYRQAIPPRLYQTFSRTGILHIFAISGLHVGVMAAILIAVLKMAGVPRPRWGWLLIPALLVYVVSTGMKPSAMRAFTMAAVYFAAPLAGRRPDAPSAVALSAVLLLAVAPSSISSPGFLLSFVVVCGLLMVHGWAARQISGYWFSGWAVPLKRLNGPHPAAALLRGAGLLVLTSLAAWVFSGPIVARFFNTLSFAALLGNLAVIPLTFLIMLTGCLALFSGIFFIPATILFNQANLLFLNLLTWIVAQLAALPGVCRAVRSPSALVIAGWYAGLICLFTGPRRWRKGALLMVLLSAGLWYQEHLGPNHNVRVLRAGDSAAALWLPETKQWVLVTDGSSFGVIRTVRLLQKEAVNQVHTLVVRGKSAEAAAVRQLEEIYRQEEVRILQEGEACVWSVGKGAVRVL